MIDLASIILTGIGALLAVLLALVCALLFKYLLSTRQEKARKSEFVYMVSVDKNGKARIKRHRQNSNIVHQWGMEDDV